MSLLIQNNAILMRKNVPILVLAGEQAMIYLAIEIMNRIVLKKYTIL